MKNGGEGRGGTHLRVLFDFVFVFSCSLPEIA